MLLELVPKNSYVAIINCKGVVKIVSKRTKG